MSAEHKTWLSHEVSVDRICEHGLSGRLDASQSVCKALAEAYDLDALERFGGTYEVRRAANGVWLVSGRIQGTVRRCCVVSLDPFDSPIDQSFGLSFVSEPMAKKTDTDTALVDPEADDPPEVLVQPVIDVGAIMCEQLALALDPFPTKPGAEFKPNHEAEAEPVHETSPFAELRRLKEDH